MPALQDIRKTLYPDMLPDEDANYPASFKIKPLTEQVEILLANFPKLNTSGVAELMAEQRGLIGTPSEGCYAIPRWQKVSKWYVSALERIRDGLTKSREGNFEVWGGEFHAEEYQRQRRTREYLAWLSRKQGTDILVVRAQFGRRHKFHSVGETRKLYLPSEFGLGAFEVGSMLLTHPDRLVHPYHLWVECPGDKYSPDSGRSFPGAPYFLVEKKDNGSEVLRYGTKGSGHNYESYGSVTGFAG
jgi:hypothetical protein